MAKKPTLEELRTLAQAAGKAVRDYGEALRKSKRGFWENGVSSLSLLSHAEFLIGYVHEGAEEIEAEDAAARDAEADPRAQRGEGGIVW